MSGEYMMYMLVVGALSLVGMLVSARLKSKFNKYSKVGLSSNLSGKEVAENMLQHYNITNVKVVEGKGFLSDHYNPQTKTIALSPMVYQGKSVAAAAVAAHECGHAVQHDTEYAMLKFRSAIVPAVKMASMAQQYLLIFALMFMGQFPALLLVVIAAFAVTTLFSFITLPVEFDASKRALVWLDNSGVTHGTEYDGAKDALWWAAMTYVVGALTSLIMLVYLILRYAGSD